MRHIIATMTNRIHAAVNVLAGRPTSYRVHYTGEVSFAPMRNAPITENRFTS